MHNAFYVFTLQTERTEKKNKMKRNPSLECVRQEHMIYLNQEKRPESDVRRRQKISTHAHTYTLTQNFNTTENKKNASAKRKRDRFSKILLDL